MAVERSIVVNGDLGSGKSTVSRLLAERLGLRRISVGDLYRQIEIVDQLVAAYQGRLAPEILRSGPLLLIDPARIYPSRGLRAGTDPDAAPSLGLGYLERHFFVITGHRHVDTALRDGRPLVAANLVAERQEPAGGGLSAQEFLQSEVTRAVIYAWGARHGIDLPLPPHLGRERAGVD